MFQFVFDFIWVFFAALNEPVASSMSAIKDMIRSSFNTLETTRKKSPTPPLPQADDSTVTKKSPIKRTATGAVRKHHECINFECDKRPTSFIEAQPFILSHFKVPAKASRVQYVCDGCYDKAIIKYEELCGCLMAKQPLFLRNSSKRPDLVEILDSSDEEDASTISKTNKSVPLSESVRNMFLNEFDSALKAVADRVQIEQQLSWANSILQEKIDANKKASDEIANEMRDMQKVADNMYSRLYRTANYVIEELPPLDLNTNKPMQLAGPTYPPFGEIVYPPVDTLTMYYSVRQKLLAPWIPSKMSEPMDAVISGVTLKHNTLVILLICLYFFTQIKTQCYKVKFLRMKGILVKCVPPTNMAYGTAPKVRLPVGK